MPGDFTLTQGRVKSHANVFLVVMRNTPTYIGGTERWKFLSLPLAPTPPTPVNHRRALAVSRLMHSHVGDIIVDRLVPHLNLLLYMFMEKQYTDDFFFDLISRCAPLSRLLREPATSTIPSE